MPRAVFPSNKAAGIKLKNVAILSDFALDPTSFQEGGNA